MEYGPCQGFPVWKLRMQVAIDIVTLSRLHCQWFGPAIDVRQKFTTIQNVDL